jgi:hypothetical protein
MIVRRDHPNLQTRFLGITTMPGSSMVAPACRDRAFAPVIRCRADFVAEATQSIGRVFKVFFRKRQTSLLTMT